MKFRHAISGIVVAGLAVCLHFNVFAFMLSGESWQNGEATIYSEGSSDPYWNDAFVQAMQYWSILPNFTYRNVNGYADPCANPFINGGETGWEFRYDNCGVAFGRSTLAVNLSWTDGNRIIQAGTVFNAKRLWDVHNGSSRIYYDFRRVAAHELGHALGLGHETVQTALMNPFYSGNIETPQTDDINGIKAIYGSATASVPVYRFWNFLSGRHFYTISQEEKNNLICCAPNMSFEGIAWYAYPNQQPNTIPVYRFYNSALPEHFYTAGESEKDHLSCCDPSWNYEGVAYFTLSQ